MIILSFDIGIKNLAFSLLKIENAKLEKVIDWGIVNLISDVCNENCSAIINDIKCNNRASNCIGRGNKKMIVCKNKRCLKWLDETWKQKHPSSKAKITSYKPKKATRYSLIHIAENIRQWIILKKSSWSSISIDRVLIEHQPVFRNPVMKSVEMILVGILVGTQFHQNIEFVHASKKTSKTNNYKDRKQISILEIEKMQKEQSNLFSTEIWKIWLNSRKRDDLADTINQALAWNIIRL